MEKEVETNVETTPEKKEEKKKSKVGLIVALIIAGSLIFISLIVLLIILFFKGSLNQPKPVVIPKPSVEEIVITFDADGGLEVEKIKFDKGTTVELPESTKDGFAFGGWFDGEKQYKTEDTATIEKDITLKAKWEELKSTESLMTINFNSNGGNKISSIQVKCINNSTQITNLPTPKRDGYNFMSWADKNGTPILNGAMLICNDKLELYANWEEVKNNKPVEKKYKCPEGYYLDGTKCKISGTVKEKCPANTRVDGDLCINVSDTNEGTRQCKEHTVSIDGKGHTWTGAGDYYMVGNSYGKCAYYKWTNYTTKSACDAAYDIYHKTVWVTELNGCYAETVMNNYETVCSADYKYYSSSELSSKFGLYGNGKCFKKVAKEQYCDDGYSLITGSCIKTIDATLE